MKITVNRQQLYKVVLAVTALCGAVATLGPEIGLLPARWQPYGVGAIAVAVALDKFLVSIGAILVGPTKLQSAGAQQQLAAMPDKSVATPAPASSVPDLDPNKPLPPIS